MAPVKRLRNAAEAQGSDLAGEAEKAPRKRLRVSNALAGSDDSESEVSDSSSVSHNVDSHDRITEHVPEPNTIGEIQRGSSRQGENVPMEHGIIERVDCYNFMCHEHFYVDLGPLINFIVGKNGSGKSAILTAITLCLGGKASVTNRGQTLKNFIKEGKESSTIVVRIKNQGDNAYLPNEFGASIVIERHFTRSGTSGFRIKSAAGRLISTKKGDLDSITDYFALQIDNPMNVLSQDMARQFIGSSSPAEKYKFFVKGVQLEQLDQDYRLIEESINHIRGKLSIHLEEMKALESKRDRTKARLALSDRQEGLRERIRNLRAQMVWAQVEEQEKIGDSCAEEVARAGENIVHLEGEVENIDRIFQDADREYEIARQAAQDSRETRDGHLENEKGVKEKHDEGLKERHELQAQQRSISEHLRAADARIKETQQKIDAENQRLGDLDGGSNARMMGELQEKEASASQLKSRYQQHKDGREGLQNNVDNAERNLGLMDKPISRKQEELHQSQTRLGILRRDRGKQQSGFPERMPMLLKAIQNENSFSQRPVGPLGNHIRLLKPQWSSVLENTLGATLSSFVVTSKGDMNILSNIMQRVNCVCSIFIGNENGSINTSAHEPDARFDTALRVLDIDNELVRRQLVISHGVEQMLLIEDLETASTTLFDGERLTNVKRCFCIDKQDRRRGIHLAYSRTGEPTSSPVSAYTGQPRMKTDIESQIRIQQDVVDNLDRELQELMQQQRQAQSQLENDRQSLADHDSQEQELQIETQKADDSAQELKDEIDRNSMNDGQLLGLKGILEEAEEEKRLNEASYEDAVNAMDALVERLRGIKRELASRATEVSSAQENVRSLEEAESQASTKRRKALGDKNIAIGRVEEAKRDKQAAEKKQEEVSERVIEWTGKAGQVSPRVSVDAGETTASLDKKFVKLTRDLERYENEMGSSREEIASAAAEANEKYELSRRQVTEFEETAQLFKNTLANRRDRWRKFQSFISARAKNQFKYLLLERGYRGDLLTDHQEKLLDLQVEPDITKDSTGRAAKTLSGGEKSFSQICLLLALWEAMGSPIRCLDEFDVYMDYLNRTMTIDMLMTAARRSVGRQFILITPGSRNDIRVAPDVRVKELAEPERGQRILPYAG